ncbi:DUF4279 domain-containing protein [Roseobacter sp. SK209-2-6]|uniref:DUF4279 domain-containing protein n=1 Tax=Roseobacter sp. SK209-2-6 TaxID=388739 RepID=UPI00056D0AA9|nr:DUF4279 domain-containing protein [Roseobacter sp. SK209-2-6]
MSSPPETDREYAYFRAVGTEDPVFVSNLLNLEPNDVWKLGDPFERNGRSFLRRGSQWKLGSGLTDQDTLSDHLSELLKRLEPQREGLLRVKEKFRTQFVCVGYYYQSFSWELDFDLQRRATALGIEFWFDTYSFGDHHEEMVELREQLEVLRNTEK